MNMWSGAAKSKGYELRLGFYVRCFNFENFKIRTLGWVCAIVRTSLMDIIKTGKVKKITRLTDDVIACLTKSIQILFLLSRIHEKISHNITGRFVCVRHIVFCDKPVECRTHNGTGMDVAVINCTDFYSIHLT